MLAPHVEQTTQRIREQETVLVAQDTSYFDVSQRDKSEELDLTQRSKLCKPSKGLMLHNTLALTTDGLPLGLLDQRFIERKCFHGADATESKRIRHCNEAIDVKESQRWIDVIRQCHTLDFSHCRTVHICDREADIYELFRDTRQLGEHVFVRAARNHAIDKAHCREEPSEWLFEKLMGRRAQTRTTVRLQVNAHEKYRNATLSITYLSISMPPPPNKTSSKDGDNIPMVQLNAIMANEKQAYNQREKLCWVLLTDLPIENAEQAIEKVQWYARRWDIEVFHKVLKSGCVVEKTQLKKAERLKKYIVLKSLVAWRLMWLARQREHNASAPCDTILDRIEWSLLSRKMNKTRKAPSVEQAFIWIAKLGGYVARPSHPDPGIVSLWQGGRGCRRLSCYLWVKLR